MHVSPLHSSQPLGCIQVILYNIDGVPKRDKALYSMKLSLLTELIGFMARHTAV